MPFAIRVSLLDRLWAAIVKARDKYRCRRCGRHGEGRGIQAAHIFSRRRRGTRWDTDNGLTLCTGCHTWGHGNPLEFHAWVEELLGSVFYERLRLRSQTITKVDEKLVAQLLKMQAEAMGLRW